MANPEFFRVPRVGLRIGQVVVWPTAPAGFAQVESFGRSRVSLIYGGPRTLVRVRVDAALLARTQLLAPLLPGFTGPADWSICPPDPYVLPADRLVDAEAGFVSNQKEVVRDTR